MDRTVPPGICLCARSFQAFRSAIHDAEGSMKVLLFLLEEINHFQKQKAPLKDGIIQSAQEPGI